MPAVAAALAGIGVFADRVAGRLAAEYAAHGPRRQPGLQPELMANRDQLGHGAGVPAQISFRHDVDDETRPSRRHGLQIRPRVMGVAVSEVAHAEAGRGSIRHWLVLATRLACGRPWPRRLENRSSDR